MANMTHTFDNYADARTLFACGRRSKDGMVRLGNNTYLAERPQIEGWPEYAVRLYDTDVVTFKHDGKIVLHSGGYVSVTTADRMDTFTPWNVRVVVRKGELVAFIDRYNVGEFTDTLTLHPPFEV